METSTTVPQDSRKDVINLDDPCTHHDLALRHWERFEQTEEREELEASITHDRTALRLRSEGHSDRVESLCNLAVSLSARYERWGQSEDLEEAIELERAALALRPQGHPDRSTSLDNLATSLSSRYELHERAEDLEEAIELERAALELRPKGHPDHSMSLNNLASSLSSRYDRYRRAEDLEEAIELGRAALELRPEGHPGRSMILINLADSLSSRYDWRGRTEDLEEAIELERAALELRPKGHPQRSTSLNNLASSLDTRYKQHGRTEDLDEAIELIRAALELRPESHPLRPTSLNHLATSLSSRYDRLGSTEDLEEAIELERAALELRPEGHPDRSRSLINLASCLSSRYDRLGSTDDLEDAIELERAALELRPKGHPNRSTSLLNLSSSLSIRFGQYGRAEDLEEAIELEQDALELRPEGHPDRFFPLINLAAYLITRYRQHGRTEDFEKAIKLQRDALELRPEGHPDCSTPLNNLASSLIIRYKQCRRAEDVEQAIVLGRAALELCPEGHPDRPTPLNNLATSLTTRYKRHGRIADFEEAIALLRAALKLCPEGHPDRSMSLRNFTASLHARIESQWDVEVFEECMHLLELAATHKFSGSIDRLLAARRWATLARSHNHKTTFAAYKGTISILQQALTVDPTLHAQHDFLLRNSDHRMLSLDAASYAIEKNQLQQAVEILEQGRGLLWSQLRGLRHPLDQLAETDEELADRFRNVSHRLENLATSHETLMSDSIVIRGGSHRLDSNLVQKSFDELLKLKRRLSREQEEIIKEIRRVPEFENFLTATPFKVLHQAASEGPVIVVNHSKYRSDALIILTRNDLPVVCVPLDDTFYKDSMNLSEELLGARRSFGAASSSYDEKLREAMQMLWDRVASKVVKELADVGITKGSRIWWCPTSVLAALPFHAAGPFTNADGTSRYLLDDYVSSYTPTLGALINARSNDNLIEPKLLIVGDTKTLKSTRQEIRNIRNCTGESILERTILLDKKASRHAVIENLQTATWIHFACHGHLGTKPFDSSFKLSDRGLTLLDIIQANVPNAEFAFLSACHTAELAHSGAHDEALHLSAAMQFSGFRSVIGTMWELYDEDGPCVARAVYGHMNEREDVEARYKLAAAGLRRAALELRSRDWVPTERWVNFVHIGA